MKEVTAQENVRSKCLKIKTLTRLIYACVPFEFSASSIKWRKLVTKCLLTQTNTYTRQTCKHKRHYLMHQVLCIKTGINVCMTGVCSSGQQHESNRVMALLYQPHHSRVMFTTISNFKAFPVLTDKSSLSTELTSEGIIDCN